MTATVLRFPDGRAVAGTVEMGRYASQVRIANGVYAGTRGVVVRVVHAACVMVRINYRGSDTVLPFGPSELEAVR